MTFSQFARHKRTVSGKTIAKCAQAIGFTPDAYLKKERGERSWSLADFIKLATLYAVPPSQLMAEWEQLENWERWKTAAKFKP